MNCFQFVYTPTWLISSQSLSTAGHRNMSTSWAVSTIDLCDCPAGDSAAKGSRRGRLLRMAWQTFSSRILKLEEFLKRETNKPLPKELRRSLRMNKSARRKGYQHHETEADKRLIEDYLNQPVNISIRIGPAFEYRPSNC